MPPPAAAGGDSVVLTPPALGPSYVALRVVVGPEVLVGGFASVRIDDAVLGADAGGRPVLDLSGVKLPSRVAPENASAHPSLAPAVGALPNDPSRELLLAPVLAF